MKIYSQNAWLVDEEVSVLGTNNPRNSRTFVRILSQKFCFKAKQHKSQKFQAMKI